MQHAAVNLQAVQTAEEVCAAAVLLLLLLLGVLV
jgi:hypothetical protein